MYSFYEITLGTPDIKNLTYEVYTHKPAQTWAKLINNCYDANRIPTKSSQRFRR